MGMLTEKTVQKALRDARQTSREVWVTDETRQRGVGRLRLRAHPNGSGTWYFRYSDGQGRQVQLPVGAYDANDTAGLGLKSARDKAGDWSKLYQAGNRDLRGYFEHQQAEETARQQEAKRKREEAERLAKSGSLKALLQGYVAHLERQGKPSAKEAGGAFKLHVFEAFPELAARRASEVAPADIAAILARLVDAGKGRSAARMRSYLGAAFTAALLAENDPAAHPDLHGFALQHNPVTAVPARGLSKFNRARERTLSESELRVFLGKLDELPQLHADTLNLLLLLGGQRPTQLLRATPADVDLDAGTVTLYDSKGARRQPRVHVLPLTERAKEIVERLLKAKGEFLISTHGKRPLWPHTVSKEVAAIAAGMVEEGAARAPFQLRDLRRTCETLLAGMGVSRDVRAQLLSHGLGGVQAMHYDRHDYMAEKQAALEAWDARLLEIAGGARAGNVVSLRGEGA